MSDKDVDAFLATHFSKKTSKLALWESQLFELFAKNQSYSTMVAFLKSKGVETKAEDVMRYIKAKKRAHLYENALRQKMQINGSQSFKKEQPKSENSTSVKVANDAEHPQRSQESKEDETNKVVKRPETKPGELPRFVYDINRPIPKW